LSLEIVVPQQTVNLSPGAETRFRIQVTNHGATQSAVRIAVSRGRAAAWAQAEPAVVATPAGESTGVDLVFRPPATASPQSTLQPFTVQAEDMRTGVVAARATGLVAITAPDLLTADLAVEKTRRRTLVAKLTVGNRGTEDLVLLVRSTVESVGDGTRSSGPVDRAGRKAAKKAERRVRAKPSVLEVAAGATAEARIVARPKRAFIGGRVPYVLRVRCVDVADEAATAMAPGFPSAGPAGSFGPAGLLDEDDAPRPASATLTGTSKPRMSRPTATILGLLLVAGLTAGGVAVSRHGGIPDRLANLNPLDRKPTGAEEGNTVQVRRPYALVDLFPRNDEPGGAAAAEATRDRFNAAGMGVRLVDSTRSDQLADGPTGFFVLLRDDFESVTEAKGFCQRYRTVAPNCQVVP
jgi:hypothetical protein